MAPPVAPKPGAGAVSPSSGPTAAPAIPGPTAPTPTPPEGGIVPPLTPPTDSTSIACTSDDSAVLTVWVPYEAKVTINGLLTKSTGSKRHFVSYGLRPGYTYKYEVKAEIVREGKIVTEKHTISLTAGDRRAWLSASIFPSSEVAARRVRRGR